jgi:hypothetical protein
MTAPAKGNDSAAREAKSISGGVLNYDVIAGHSIRAVVVAGDICVVAHLQAPLLVGLKTNDTITTTEYLTRGALQLSVGC